MVHNVKREVLDDNKHNSDLISLLKRNAHNGKRSVIYFDNHEYCLPKGDIDIKITKHLMNIYHKDILIALIDTRRISAVCQVEP